MLPPNQGEPLVLSSNTTSNVVEHPWPVPAPPIHAPSLHLRSAHRNGESRLFPARFVMLDVATYPDCTVIGVPSNRLRQRWNPSFANHFLDDGLKPRLARLPQHQCCRKVRIQHRSQATRTRPACGVDMEPPSSAHTADKRHPFAGVLEDVPGSGQRPESMCSWSDRDQRHSLGSS